MKPLHLASGMTCSTGAIRESQTKISIADLATQIVDSRLVCVRTSYTTQTISATKFKIVCSIKYLIRKP